MSTAQQLAARALLHLGGPDELRRLAGDDLPPVGHHSRAARIAEQEIDPVVLDRLSSDRRVTVRRAVAANPHTSDATRSKLWYWALSTADTACAAALARTARNEERAGAVASLIQLSGDGLSPRWDSKALVALTQGVGEDLVIALGALDGWRHDDLIAAICDGEVAGVSSASLLAYWMRNNLPVADGRGVTHFAQSALSWARSDAADELSRKQILDDAFTLAERHPSFHSTLVVAAQDTVDPDRWVTAWLRDGAPVVPWSYLHKVIPHTTLTNVKLAIGAFAEIGARGALPEVRSEPGAVVEIAKILCAVDHRINLPDSPTTSELLDQVDEELMPAVALLGLKGAHRFEMDMPLIERLIEWFGANEVPVDAASSRWSGRVARSAADRLAEIDHPDVRRVAILSGAGRTVRLRAARAGTHTSALLATTCASLEEARLVTEAVVGNPSSFRDALRRFGDAWIGSVLDCAAADAGRTVADLANPEVCADEVANIIMPLAALLGTVVAWHRPARARHLLGWLAGAHPVGAPAIAPPLPTNSRYELCCSVVEAWHSAGGATTGRLPWHLSALVESVPHILNYIDGDLTDAAGSAVHAHIQATLVDTLGHHAGRWEALAVLSAESDAGIADLAGIAAALVSA